MRKTVTPKEGGLFTDKDYLNQHRGSGVDK